MLAPCLDEHINPRNESGQEPTGFWCAQRLELAERSLLLVGGKGELALQRSMLPKQSRLTREQFQAVFRSSRRISLPGLLLLYAPASIFRASVVVSKKVSSKATDRNRLRRMLYDLLSSSVEKCECVGSYILIAQPSVNTLTQKDIIAGLETGLKRLGKVDTAS